MADDTRQSRPAEPTTPEKKLTTPDDKRLISFRIAHTPEATSPTRKSNPQSPARRSPQTSPKASPTSKASSPKSKASPRQSSRLKADAVPFPVVEVRVPRGCERFGLGRRAPPGP